MVCCDCSQVKPKPPLWQVGSLLGVLLPLFYHPLVLLIGQTNCPPALSDQLGSSSPGTPAASLGAGKSGQTQTNFKKKGNIETALICWLILHVYSSDVTSTPYLHYTILPDDHAPVAGFCFAGASLTRRKPWCHEAAAHFLLWRCCAGVWVSIQHFLLIIHYVTTQTFNINQIHEHTGHAVTGGICPYGGDALPEVLDDGLCFRLTPHDDVLFDWAAHFVFCGEHSTYISVRTQCDYAWLLMDERQISDKLITVTSYLSELRGSCY